MMEQSGGRSFTLWGDSTPTQGTDPTEYDDHDDCRHQLQDLCHDVLLSAATARMLAETSTGTPDVPDPVALRLHQIVSEAEHIAGMCQQVLEPPRHDEDVRVDVIAANAVASQHGRNIPGHLAPACQSDRQRVPRWRTPRTGPSDRPSERERRHRRGVQLRARSETRHRCPASTTDQGTARPSHRGRDRKRARGPGGGHPHAPRRPSSDHRPPQVPADRRAANEHIDGGGS